MFSKERKLKYTFLSTGIIIGLLGLLILNGANLAYETKAVAAESTRTVNIQSTATARAEHNLGLDIPENFNHEILDRIVRIWPMDNDSNEEYSSSCTATIMGTELIDDPIRFSEPVVKTELLTADHCFTKDDDMVDVVFSNQAHYGASVTDIHELPTNKNSGNDRPVIATVYSRQSVWDIAGQFDEPLILGSIGDINQNENITVCGYPAAVQNPDSVASAVLFCATSAFAGYYEGFVQTIPSEYGEGVSGAPAFDGEGNISGVTRGSFATHSSQDGFIIPIAK